MSLTDEDLALWEAKVADTTPGEWKCWNGYGPVDGHMGVLRIGPDDPACMAGLTSSMPAHDIHGTRADIEFVAFAHNNLPELLAECARLREENAELRVRAELMADDAPCRSFPEVPSPRRLNPRATQAKGRDSQ